MERLLKIGILGIVAFAGLTLLTLRLTGFDPPYLDAGSEEFSERGRTGYPGLWLSGELVREPVTNWDWVNEVTILFAATPSCWRLVPGTEFPSLW